MTWNKSKWVLFLVIVIVCTDMASANFDFSCETPVTVTEQFDGEIKYSCMVKNTGDSFLTLRYEVQPEQNPINPNVAVGFHPKPSLIYLEAGESQPIVGFEVPPRVMGKEISYTRDIIVRDDNEAKQITITTIIKNELLNEEAKIFGKVLDAQTSQPIVEAEIFLKYRRYEARSRTSPRGEFQSSVPALDYLMI